MLEHNQYTFAVKFFEDETYVSRRMKLQTSAKLHLYRYERKPNNNFYVINIVRGIPKEMTKIGISIGR